MQSSLKLLLVFAGILSSVLVAKGEETPDAWITYYYRNPTPGKVIEQFQIMTNRGVFKDPYAHPPVVAFLSQIMAQNPKMIREWMKAFETIDDTQRAPLQAAAWYSDTPEAREYFKEQKFEVFLKEKAPKILEITVDNPSVLDMQWGYFMATGDSTPIRRIITAFSLSKYAGALDRFKTSAKSDQDKKEAYYEATFQAAQWSLESNCRTHPLVLEHCEKFYAGQDLTQVESLWLGVLLSKIKPEKYSVEIGNKKTEKGTAPTSNRSEPK